MGAQDTVTSGESLELSVEAAVAPVDLDTVQDRWETHKSSQEIFIETRNRLQATLNTLYIGRRIQYKRKTGVIKKVEIISHLSGDTFKTEIKLISNNGTLIVSTAWAEASLEQVTFID